MMIHTKQLWNHKKKQINHMISNQQTRTQWKSSRAFDETAWFHRWLVDSSNELGQKPTVFSRDSSWPNFSRFSAVTNSKNYAKKSRCTRIDGTDAIQPNRYVDAIENTSVHITGKWPHCVVACFAYRETALPQRHIYADCRCRLSLICGNLSGGESPISIEEKMSGSFNTD